MKEIDLQDAQNSTFRRTGRLELERSIEILRNRVLELEKTLVTEREAYSTLYKRDKEIKEQVMELLQRF